MKAFSLLDGLSNIFTSITRIVFTLWKSKKHICFPCIAHTHTHTHTQKGHLREEQ